MFTKKPDNLTLEGQLRLAKSSYENYKILTEQQIQTLRKLISALETDLALKDKRIEALVGLNKEQRSTIEKLQQN